MGRKNSAFTLVELMIVISIVAILALIALFAFRDQLFKGNDAKRKSDIDRIKIAAEEYEKDHSCYPLSSIMSCNPGKGLVPYLDKIPCDPITHASYFYFYDNNSCPRWFKLYTVLENTADTSILPGIGPNSAFNYVAGSSNSPPDATAPPSVGGGSTPPPGGNATSFYGCENGVCVPISWDATRPGPACDPNYQSSNCYEQCGPSANECTPWH